MSRLLVISDLHHKTAKAEAIIAHEPHDAVLFGGDYQDDFDDTDEDAHRTATWLKDSLMKPDRVHLLGNHDICYAYSFNVYTQCSGFTRAKDYRIWQVMNRGDFDKLKWWYAQDGILFTHAGLSAKLLKRYTKGAVQTLDQAIEWLESEYPKARERLENDGNHFLYGAGWSRGGREPVGGLVWNDADVDGLPTPFPQICFHTPHPHPLFYLRKPKGPRIEVKRASDTVPADLKDNWWVLDMDTHMNHYAVIDDGVLTVKEISWSGLGNKNIGRTSVVFEGRING